MEMETLGKLLVGDPSNGARRGIESVDRCVKTANQFEVERDVFPDAKGIDERPIQQGVRAEGPASADVSQVDHAAIDLFPNIDVAAGEDSSRALYGLEWSLEKVHRWRPPEPWRRERIQEKRSASNEELNLPLVGRRVFAMADKSQSRRTRVLLTFASAGPTAEPVTLPRRTEASTMGLEQNRLRFVSPGVLEAGRKKDEVVYIEVSRSTC